ncbi:hypothetical protein BJV82DRAFT_220289 [Fennellomyces sp. T-0311]|nr:hypothetical protein BJV82DRAFT_220289 [Fennellomyces sp. T-0311]
MCRLAPQYPLDRSQLVYSLIRKPVTLLPLSESLGVFYCFVCVWLSALCFLSLPAHNTQIQIMVCLGPRKKPAKKPGLLSPDDAATRSVKGSLTKKKSATPLTKRKSTASVASTNTVDNTGKQLRRPTSRSSIARPASPDNRPRSPHTRPPPPPGTAPSVRSSARPGSHSRNASTASSVRKSPVAQMREEFDELKLKVSEAHANGIQNRLIWYVA